MGHEHLGRQSHRPVQGVEIERRCIAPPLGQMDVNAVQQVCIAPFAGGEIQAGGQKHDRRFLQAVLAAVARGEETVGHHSVRLAGDHRRIALIQRIYANRLVRMVAAGHQLGEKFFLNASLQNGDALAGEVGQGVQLEVGTAVDLRPTAGDRDLMKVETLLPLAGKGHVRHQVEPSLLQLLQTVGPLAGNVAQRPVFGAGDFIEQFDEQTGRAVVCAGVDFGRVLVKSDGDNPPLGLHDPWPDGDRQSGQRRQDDDGQQVANVFHAPMITL